MGKLSNLKIKNTKPPAGKSPKKLLDGGGLYLYVAPTGAKNWVFRYVISGREQNMGMGSYTDTSLSEARETATQYRKAKRDGIDPKDYRRKELEKLREQYAKNKLFRDLAEDFIENKKSGWKSKKHEGQWISTLATYAYPTIGDMPVDIIQIEDILKILKPIWNEKPETATRVRQRLEAILDAAITLKHRTSENPARWKGHLENLLPKRGKVKKVQHHPALPYKQAPGFMKKLKPRTSIGAQALQFTILTACRTNEVINARWDEFDLDEAVWIIPEDRMKAGREHRVPLSSSVIALLGSIDKQSEFVFNGARANKPISDATMRKYLQHDMGHKNLVVHGFRSTFRDWTAEETNYPNIVAEMSLAHTIKDRAEASYRRGDLFKRRSRLMEDWDRYLRED